MEDFALGHAGGCLCGQVRYRTVRPPANAFICNCRFCQKLTGGPHLLEHCFFQGDVEVVKGKPKTYTHISLGSGKKVFPHFCEYCGSPLFMTFERYPDSINIFTTSLDQPGMVDYSPDALQFLFQESAMSGTVIPAGYKAFAGHCDPAGGSEPRATVTESDVLQGDPESAGETHTGGCLCGAVRYEADGDPDFLVICHCRSCQMSLGANVHHELLFDRAKFRVTKGEPASFIHPGGSARQMNRHFCRDCGSALWVTGERFPEIGICRGTLDWPNQIPFRPENAVQLFLDEALPISMVIEGIEAFHGHRRNPDETINRGVVYPTHWRIADGPPRPR